MTVQRTNTLRIAVLAGDGIGKEVMLEGLQVLDAVSRKFQVDLRFEHLRLVMRAHEVDRKNDA